MTQIVVVGAGPTGVTISLLLAQRGISVALIEAAQGFQRIFRGEALMPSGLEALTQMGLSKTIANIPHQPLAAWEVVIENRSLFRVQEPMTIGSLPCTLVSQPALLQALIAQASAYPNFEFVAGTAVQDLLWDGERVVGVKLPGEREICADLVIGCDGRNSVVRRQAHLTLEQQPSDFDILWFSMAALPDLENVFYSFVRDRQSFGVFRSATGRLQIGWSLYADNEIDWKTADWPSILAAASPPWLAEHIRAQASTIAKPMLLPIVVGRCPRWYTPGLLILGDAAHPMSPIRAQGINMALRDAIVAVNYLVPALQRHAGHPEIDELLPKIQADREAEIIPVQALQAAEMGQAKLLRNYPILRHAASLLAPVIGSKIRKSWLIRQQTLRQGLTQVNLKV